jgi:hypothetical protein
VIAVNLDKLTKQLRRDMAANPKKAALLGLMVVVAMYFWGPLVWKFASVAGGKPRSNANLASLILMDDPADSPQQGKTRSGGKFRWDKVREIIRQDPHMLPATFDPSWVNPFGKSASEIARSVAAETPVDAPPAAVVAPAVDPKDLGIVLGGVMIGVRTRLATINGEACREGDVFSLKTNDKTATVELRVLKINRHSVQLESGGRVFTLELVSPELAHGDEFQTAKIK